MNAEKVEGETNIPSMREFSNRYQFDLGSNRPAPARLSYEELMIRRSSAVSAAKALATKMSEDPALESIAVDAGQIGEGFRLIVDQPVSLPRQKSALLPVQHGPLTLSRISIYNRSTHPRFPLQGAKIKNTTGQHILAGPATVTDANGYIGDCKLPNLQPNEERLISFAMDLGLEIRPETKSDKDELGPIRLAERCVFRTNTKKNATIYRIHNRSTKPRILYVDHPRSTWKIIGKNQPKESEKDFHHFVWTVDANKIVEESVAEQTTTESYSYLSSLAPNEIRDYLAIPNTSKTVKEALATLLDLRILAVQADDQARKSDTQIKAILSEQDRLGNLARLPAGSAAHKRYLDKFDRLEGEVEKLQVSHREKLAAKESIDQKVETFVRALDVK